MTIRSPQMHALLQSCGVLVSLVGLGLISGRFAHVGIFVSPMASHMCVNVCLRALCCFCVCRTIVVCQRKHSHQAQGCQNLAAVMRSPLFLSFPFFFFSFPFPFASFAPSKCFNGLQRNLLSARRLAMGGAAAPPLFCFVL